MRGLHTPTATTRTLLLRRLEIDDATLSGLAHGRKEGPLVPAYIALFELLETVFVDGFDTTTIGKVHCTCCGADMLNDGAVWWPKQGLAVPADGAIFIDRLLKALLGAVLLMDGIGQLLGTGHLNIDEAIGLAVPDCHPMGHWMALVRRHRGLRHDWQLTVATDPPLQGPVSDGLLRKWRNGQHLMPMERARSMIEPGREETSLTHALYVARTISLAIDVARASSDAVARPSRAAAQKVIHARLQQLLEHFRIAQATAARR